MQLIVHTIDENNLENALLTTTFSASCSKETLWTLGSTLINYIRMSNFTGITGEIMFDPKTGYRKNSVLYIVDITKNGIDLVMRVL